MRLRNWIGIGVNGNFGGASAAHALKETTSWHMRRRIWDALMVELVQFAGSTEAEDFSLVVNESSCQSSGAFRLV